MSMWIAFSQHGVITVGTALHSLIEKQPKFASYVRKFRWFSGEKLYMRKGFLIYEEMHKYFHHI